MAVPKKRTGASAQGHRRANWKATVPETTNCKICNGGVLEQSVCPVCVFYKKAAVSIKNPNYVSLDATKAKKTSKKAAAVKPAAKTKKAEKVENKVEEVKVAAEEIVTEATVEAVAETASEAADKASVVEEKAEE